MPRKNPRKTSQLSRRPAVDSPAGFARLGLAALDAIAGGSPRSTEPRSRTPAIRARELAQATALRAAIVSGTFSLPPGALGLITAIPELLTVWRLQAKMVADIASAFGQDAPVERKQMVYCLFKNMACQVARDVVVRVAERAVVRKASMSLLERMVFRVGVPVIGAAGAAGYAWFDTMQVANRAIELFQQERAKTRQRKPAAKKRAKIIPFPGEAGRETSRTPRRKSRLRPAA